MSHNAMNISSNPSYGSGVSVAPYSDSRGQVLGKHVPVNV